MQCTNRMPPCAPAASTPPITLPAAAVSRPPSDHTACRLRSADHTDLAHSVSINYRQPVLLCPQTLQKAPY